MLPKSYIIGINSYETVNCQLSHEHHDVTITNVKPLNFCNEKLSQLDDKAFCNIVGQYSLVIEQL